MQVQTGVNVSWLKGLAEKIFLSARGGKVIVNVVADWGKIVNKATKFFDKVTKRGYQAKVVPVNSELTEIIIWRE